MSTLTIENRGAMRVHGEMQTTDPTTAKAASTSLAKLERSAGWIPLDGLKSLAFIMFGTGNADQTFNWALDLAIPVGPGVGQYEQTEDDGTNRDKLIETIATGTATLGTIVGQGGSLAATERICDQIAKTALTDPFEDFIESMMGVTLAIKSTGDNTIGALGMADFGPALAARLRCGGGSASGANALAVLMT